VIWLEYENTENKSEWISTSELTYVINLLSNFHIIYSTKLSLLLCHNNAVYFVCFNLTLAFMYFLWGFFIVKFSDFNFTFIS